MSAFTPTSRILQPSNQADDLSNAVVQALSRRFNPILTWSLPRTLVLGLISGGLLPLLALTRRFKNFCDAERFQLAYFSEWINTHGDAIDVRKLMSAEKLRFRGWLGTVSVLLAVAAAGVVLMHFQNRFVDPIQLVQFLTLHDGPSRSAALFAVLMSAAFLTTLLHVNWHIADVRRFSRSVNKAVAGMPFEQIAPPRFGVGFRPFWVISGVILAIFGAIWALPMMLATAAHRSYIIDTGRRWRRSLASGVREVVIRQSPTAEVSMSRE